MSGRSIEAKALYSFCIRNRVPDDYLLRLIDRFVDLASICSERRLFDEVYLKLAYCRFCRSDLDGIVPDLSIFINDRNGRFHDSILQHQPHRSSVDARMVSHRQADQSDIMAELPQHTPH